MTDSRLEESERVCEKLLGLVEYYEERANHYLEHAVRERFLGVLRKKVILDQSWQLFGERQAIREAARIFDLLVLGKPGFEQLTLHDLLSWLALPVVAQARKLP